jgi:hypothetical protein
MYILNHVIGLYKPRESGYQEWKINRNWQLHNYHYIYSFIYSYNMYVPSSIDKYWNIKW